MENFICHNNQVFCILFFFFYYVCFQVNSLSSSTSLPSYSPNTTHYFLCPPNQSFALLQFKSQVTVGSTPQYYCDPNSSDKTASWMESTDCCSWDGITCDEVTGNVIGLDLHCSLLKGTIQDNSSIFQLSHLQWLNLGFNNFNGSKISPEIGRLTHLTELNFSYSKFYGPLPTEISRLYKLTSLDLSDSSFLISIDQQNFDLLASSLTRLTALNLGGTDMSSVKPSSLLNLSRSLMVLDLGNALIQGELPEEIFRFPNLQELYLYYNAHLTGYLPNSNWSSHLRILYLSYTNLKGEIPDSIGNLKCLEVLALGGCKFTGLIPTSVGNLTRLTDLKLFSNYLTGELPSSLSKLEKLTQINLYENMLTGQIPNIFVNFSLSPPSDPQFPCPVNVLSHLTNLDLSFNLFNGSVPSWLFTLPSLEYIDLSNNKLTAPIEQVDLGLPNSLRAVHLQNNHIHGSIPTSIFKLVNLTLLDISSNNLSGTVKFDLLSKLNNLQYLDLSNNNLLSFSSTSNMNYSMPNLTSLRFSSCNVIKFPMFLRTLENLQWLDLSNNRICGPIFKSESEGWKNLTYLNLSNNFLTYIEHHPWKNIQILDLQNNRIQGSIPIPPPSIEVFLFSNNSLSGQIPPSICKLTSLQYLSLSDNNLRGTIPPCLGNFGTGLIMLHLQKNNLQGVIPDTLANASLLKSLDLNSNLLEGPLPRSMTNCTQLEVVNVGNNRISDTFPCWLGSLSELKILVLRSNRFFGPLCDFDEVDLSIFPFQSLRILDLSHNEFTGFLPSRNFARMEAMMNADEDGSGGQYMVESYYSDSVSVTMKGGEYMLDRILTIFTSIDLSRNQFRGEIPEVIGKFKSLLVLNLSHNSLTGNIPLSLANLEALESLDLSFNKLDGRIPEQLTSLTTLEVLNLSFNSLWGRIPQGNQFNTFENYSFIGNKGLCGEPLSAKCGPSSDYDEEDKIVIEFDFQIAAIGFASGLAVGTSTAYCIFSTGKPRWFVRMVEGKRPIKKVRTCSQRR
ncbi:Receptor-like protein [Melia azedarach]|uniref:Receptor-like protein n=1 Tax=Melia azedarach TaxID=155640 RepID=A0ACC1YSZ2_MELAZ|nr:Receptor-like protein [Melia azedarach]